jgi:HPt (histidine-containing phosphotransfer) domain-containing protein
VQESKSGTITEAALNSALDRLWIKFLPQITERIAILESAADALASGRLASDLRNEATAAAHKLAGVLGSFGLGQGTTFAREAETFYSSALEPDPSYSGRLKFLAAQMRATVESRK